MNQALPRRSDRLQALALILMLSTVGCTPLYPDQSPAPGAPNDTQDLTSGRFEKAGTLERLADRALATGDYPTALNMYQQAVLNTPNDPTLHVRIGDTLVAMSRWQDAADAYQRALRSDNSLPDANAGYGRVLLGLDKPEEASIYFEAVLDQEPENMKALNGLAVSHDLSGRHAQAARVYSRALALDPADKTLRNNLGLSQALSGNYDEAVRILRPLATGPEADERSRQNLALALGLAGDAEGAARIASVDLNEAEVDSNLAYYEALRHQETSEAALSAVGVHPAAAPRANANPNGGGPIEPDGDPQPLFNNRGQSAAPTRGPVAVAEAAGEGSEQETVATETLSAPNTGRTDMAVEMPEEKPAEVAAAPVAKTMPETIADEAPAMSGQEVQEAAAPMMSEAETTPVVAAEAPRQRAEEDTEAPTKLDVARSGSSGAVAAAYDPQVADVVLTPRSGWYLDLGRYGSADEATTAWNELKQAYGETLEDLPRLGGHEEGVQPLILGPAIDAEVAATLCAELAGDGRRCRAVRF
ncbi:MAG: tetratricopeptide repeat protein [Geminicoccaceae bacterium]